MSSISSDTAIKYAVEVCLRHPLKHYLLSEFPSKAAYYTAEGWHCTVDEHLHRRELNDMVKKLAAEILEDMTMPGGIGSLPKELQERVMNFVIPVGRKMLTWSESFHRRFVIRRSLLIKILKKELFTDLGTIDNEKAAEALINEDLTIRQKYSVVCLYCSEELIIPVLREMMSVHKPPPKMPPYFLQGLKHFWYSYHNGWLKKVMCERNINLFRLSEAIDSGGKAAVQCSVNERTPKKALVKAAVSAMASCLAHENDDWIPFRPAVFFPHRKLKQQLRSQWVPSYFYLDILCLLLSKMDLEQKDQFLRQDLEGDEYRKLHIPDKGHPRRSRVLECFLKFPYQSLFLETAQLVRHFVPSNHFSVLVLKICDKIELRDEQNIEYGEEKSYDYTGLLLDFWNQSHQCDRNHFLWNPQVTYVAERTYVVKAAEGLLVKLLALENFRTEEGNLIRSISMEATDKQRETITSGEVMTICCELSKKKRWDVLNQFSQNWFPTDEERNSFTKKVIYTESDQLVFIDFLKSSNWDAVGEFTRWGTLNEDEANKFKEDVIRSVAGEETLMELLFNDSTEVADEILKRCLPSEKTIEEYKNKLALSDTGVRGCANLLVKENTELAEKWFSWCLLSREEIGELKYRSLKKVTSFVRDILKSGNSDLRNAKFQRGKWERADKLLDWCLASEWNVEEFKRNELHTGSGERILYDSILSHGYEDAELLLRWLGLFHYELKHLRLQTANIFADEWISRTFVCSEATGKLDYEIKGLYTMLDWCLRSEEVVRIFRDRLRSKSIDSLSYEQGKVRRILLQKAEELLKEMIAKRIKT